MGGGCAGKRGEDTRGLQGEHGGRRSCGAGRQGACLAGEEGARRCPAPRNSHAVPHCRSVGVLRGPQALQGALQGVLAEAHGAPAAALPPLPCPAQPSSARGLHSTPAASQLLPRLPASWLPLGAPFLYCWPCCCLGCRPWNQLCRPETAAQAHPDAAKPAKEGPDVGWTTGFADEPRPAQLPGVRQGQAKAGRPGGCLRLPSLWPCLLPCFCACHPPQPAKGKWRSAAAIGPRLHNSPSPVGVVT